MGNPLAAAAGGLFSIVADAAEIAAAAVVAAASLALAEEAYEEWKEATDDLEDAMARQIAMVEDQHAHTLGVTHAYLQTAMQEAFNYPVDAPDYGGVCSRMGTEIDRIYGRLQRADTSYHKSFCQTRRRTGQIGHATGLAAVDAAFARGKFQERRRNRQEENRTRVIQNAHSGTFVNANAAFGLMNNAIEIFQNMSNSAIQALGGNLASFGAGLTAALSPSSNNAETAAPSSADSAGVTAGGEE